jgi:predicted site-specific integrase-resolvase
MNEIIPAEELARRLGILTATLAKWRRTGRGPRRWVYLSKNRVGYPKEAVDAYFAALSNDGNPRTVEIHAALGTKYRCRSS